MPIDYTHSLRNLLAANPLLTLAYIDQATPDHVLHVYFRDGHAATKLVLNVQILHLHVVEHSPVHFNVLRCPATSPRGSRRSTACQDEPIQLGCQIQPYHGDWVGTAGAPASWLDLDGRRRWGILSNWHVMADRGQPGDAQYQPDRSNPSPVAWLDRAVPPQPDRENLVDAAVADAYVDGFHTISDKILTIGPLNPKPLDAEVGLDVCKHGRTTDLTCGVVHATDAAVRVGYDGSEFTFTHQIVVKDTVKPFSAPGDSGSLIVDSPEHRPVALLFAGGADLTIANPIQAVIFALDLRFNL